MYASTGIRCNLRKLSHKATEAKITKLLDFANSFRHSEHDCSENYVIAYSTDI